jgi:hypothetical protein
MKIKTKQPSSRLVRALKFAPMLAAASLVPLQAGTFSNNFGADPAGLVTFEGSATWVDTGGGTGYVSITEAANSLQGGMGIADFDNGEAVGNFTATFKLQIGPGSGNAADGFSFNWAPDAAVNTGEEGSGTGLTISWDIYDNGGGEAPSIDAKVGGTTIAQKKMTKAEIMTTGFADVKVELKNGLLSVDYKGQSVFASIPVGVPPQTGASFTFGARTGGENAAQYIDDVNITTSPATQPVVTTFRSNAKGFIVRVVDAPGAAVDSTTMTATVDGAAVTGSATKTGDTTTYTFTNPGVYTAGTTHPVVLSYSYGTPATATTTTLSFTVGNYTSIPATAALAATPTTRGFSWRVHQVDSATDLANTTARTEQQLAGLLGPNVADPAAQSNASGPSTTPVPTDLPLEFTIPTVINYKDAPGGSGSFTGDFDFPGIPGTTGSDNNIAGEVLAGIEFPAAGVYRLVVNSDDGFVTTIGKNPRDPSNPVLGSFEGGRGPADSPFDIYIPQAGVYPMRTIWEEGGGGAALEIFSEALDGTRILLNDTATDPNALKAYLLPASATPAYVGVTTPSGGETLITRPSTIEAHLFDAGTTVTDGSISVKFNGVAGTVNATRSGTETTVIGTPATPLLANTAYTVDLTYSDNTGPHTVSWTFTTGPLSTTLFVIEAEDFDYSTDDVTGGLHNPQKGTAGLDVDVMPYYGGAYDGLSAVLNVDYFSNDPPDGGNYRTENGFGDGNDVSMYRNDNNVGGNGLGGNLSINSSDRGTYRTTVNYSHGWSGGDWFNYTREFPTTGTGWWNAYIGLSYGGADAGQLSATLSRVTEGVGTTDQVLELLGTFNGPGSGNWARNNLVPMRTASGALATVKLQGLQTVRASISSGDYDFIIFSAANPPPPSISATPVDSVKRDAVILDWTLADGGSLVNASTVKVMLNNQDVTSKATVTKTASGATIHLDLTGTTYPAGEIPWTITFADNATPAQTVSNSGTVVINPYPTAGVFVIEAEDFNYSADGITGGLTNPKKGEAGQDVDVMPYFGGAYADLSAISEVDFHGNDGEDGSIYRTEVDPAPTVEGQVNMISMSNDTTSRYSTDRGTFTTTSNYRIGWAGDNWFNYTRTFPDNTYQVWAALSYGGTGAGQLRGSLDLVTSNPAQPSQTVQQLGTFEAAGSNGWGRNELVPMKVNGQIATVALSGVKTVRYNMPSGDFDYLLFVPTSTPPPPVSATISRNANGTITITASEPGTLQSTTSLTPPVTWTNEGAISGSRTLDATGTMRFFRILDNP